MQPPRPFFENHLDLNQAAILELPTGGYCLRLHGENGEILTTGSYATPEDAVRIARLNGYAVQVEAAPATCQLLLDLGIAQLAFSV